MMAMPLAKSILMVHGDLPKVYSEAVYGRVRLCCIRNVMKLFLLTYEFRSRRSSYSWVAVHYEWSSLRFIEGIQWNRSSNDGMWFMWLETSLKFLGMNLYRATPHCRRFQFSHCPGLMPYLSSQDFKAHYQHRSGQEVIFSLCRLDCIADGFFLIALNISYATGPGPVQVHIELEMEFSTKDIWNVVGIIRGNEEPDRLVIIGTINSITFIA